MKKRAMISLLAVAVLIVGFTLSVGADFGDYGGDYDYGGYDSYDSYDYDSYDSYDYDSYDYDDYDGGYYYGGTSGGTSYVSDEITPGSAIIGLIVLALFVYAFLKKSGLIGKGDFKKSKPNVTVAPGAAPTAASSLRSVPEYLDVDPSFSEHEFTEKLSNMYVRFQNAWQAKNLEELRPYLTDSFYAQCDRQLDRYRREARTNIVDRITVLGVQLVGWKQENGEDVMVARLKTRIVDYVIDDATGNVVRGSNTAEKFMEYEWILVRSTGTLTRDSNGTTAQNCPNCGAPININHSTRCEYCNSIITTDSFDWAVREIKGLSQRTVG